MANDLSPHLIVLYRAVQQGAVEVASELRRVAETYGGRDASGAPAAGYYGARAEFNRASPASDSTAPLPSPARRAALLLYLIARGFNGVFRTNASGAWNVPEGDVARPALATQARLEAFARAVAGWTFSCVDFQPVVDGARFGDSIFADPPYADLPEGVQRTPIFTGYTPGGYGAHDQVRLADALTRARGRGCVVVHTNSASPKIQDLYRERGFITLPTAELRAVSRDASTRSRRGCLLVVSHPEVVA